MTLLGKSFSVVIFVLSLTFMVLALAVNASHRNWRDVVMGQGGLKEKIETTERTNSQLRDSQLRTQAALDREQAARRTALAALQTQLTRLETDLQDSEASLQEYASKNAQLAQVDKFRAEALEKLTTEANELRQQIRTEQSDRDKLFAETLVLTDTMNKLRGTLQLQKERNDQLMAQVTRFEEVVSAHGIDINDPLDGSPPERNGTVLVINRPRDLVEVSIGHDDGLRPGHLLEVTRSGRYVGKVRVRNTEPDKAVAEIMRDYSEGIILEGDRVDTSLD
tara:strand:- start:471411 stop:472247 length:837 start_codon:yes stop_codon:yes gene_type:complete